MRDSAASMPLLPRRLLMMNLAGDFIVKLKEMPASHTVLGSPLRPGGMVSRVVAVSHASE